MGKRGLRGSQGSEGAEGPKGLRVSFSCILYINHLRVKVEVNVACSYRGY
jgi:hypothetical protein